MAEKKAPAQPAGSAPEAKGAAPRSGGIEWLQDHMTTHFANVVNVQSTREQVDLFFGTNQTWNIAGSDKVSVELSNRIILTPFAAKRLLTVLGSVLKEYEGRYGTLNIER
jgi:hypothetical protein